MFADPAQYLGENGHGKIARCHVVPNVHDEGARKGLQVMQVGVLDAPLVFDVVPCLAVLLACLRALACLSTGQSPGDVLAHGTSDADLA